MKLRLTEQEKKSILSLYNEQYNEKKDVVFVGGLDNLYNSSYKSLSEQTELLKNGLGSGFNVISFRFTNDDGAKNYLKQNPNSFVVLFSAGGKHSGEIVDLVSDKTKMYIVEPYTKSSDRVSMIDRVVSKGVPRKNVLGGQSNSTGNNVAGTFRTSGTHWDALTNVGKIIKGTGR